MTTPRHGRGHGPRLPRLLLAGPSSITYINYIQMYRLANSGECKNKNIPGAVSEKCPSFFVFCRKLARMKTEKSKDKTSKRNGRTVLTGGGVNFVFYPYINFTSSIFAPTPLFSSFHQARYRFRCRNYDCESVIPSRTPPPPRLPIPHTILWGGAASFFGH